jgi:RNA polymerase sigma-70 factor (ECF subfamily)
MSVSDADVATFQAIRPRLFGIAHRVLGDVAEAEDVVQDAWIRWHRTDRREVRNAEAFLATATTRLGINVSHSVWARHEALTDAWLAEPIDPTADPLAGAARTEALEAALLALVEKLSPTERAVFVLREAFDYSHREIADALDLSEANALQLALRARTRLLRGRRRPADGDEHRRLVAAFTRASQTGDLTQLEGLLAAEVEMHVSSAIAA